MVTVKHNKKQYFNCAISFDIETSSFWNEVYQKEACMYIWQVCFCGGIIIGRTWPDFVNLMHLMHNYYGTDDEHIMTIYVHNLSFEFQWMRKWFSWKNVFAITERKVIRAVTDIGIEFKCSYILSNKSLQKLAEDLPDKYNGIAKLTGELDYQQIRGPETPLTDEELQYCINDVLIVVYYIQDKLENECKICNIPLTSTGYVRKAMRNNCLYDKANHGARAYKYRKMISNLTLSVEDYMMLKAAFQGGFVHANCLYSGQTLNEVGSIDLTSAYPAEMIKQRFPMSAFRNVKVHSKAEFRNYLEKYCCLFQVEFTGLKSSVIWEHIISESRCQIAEGEFIDNGRIVEADRIVMTITEQDFFIYEKYYTWESMRIGVFKIAYKGYLPTPVIETVLEFYKNKTELKGVQGKEKDLMLNKNLLNSCYGMLVTDVLRASTVYENDEWKEIPVDYEAEIKKHNESKSRFLYYAWGIWVTAYCRKTILMSIYAEFKDDYVYSDTDSIKFRHPERHMEWIDKFNRYVDRTVSAALEAHRLPADAAAPMNLKGEQKHIGRFEFEVVYDKFKSLGAKRYLVDIDGDISLTCSGLNSFDAGSFIASKEKPFEFFNDNMYIPPEYTGKLTHTYIDEETSDVITDYKGNEFRFRELSSAHLEPQDYSLNIGRIYADFLKGVKTKYVQK